MINISKRSMLLLFVVMFTLLVTRNHYRKLAESGDWKVLCVDQNMALTSPVAADGLLMKNNTLPGEWLPFDTSQLSQNESDRRIFFHETSGQINLTMKQTCAIESVAKHNPDRPVHLFFRPANSCSGTTSTSFYYNPLWLEILSGYPNVAAVLLNHDHYFIGTPLEKWYDIGEWRNSPFSTAHLSDYIRILSLYKSGGLYSDLDILTLRPYSGKQFRNFLSYDSTNMDVIINTVMHLERGHWLTVEIMRLLSAEYDPNDYAYHGPQAVSAVMQSSCGMKQGDPSSNNCYDLRVLPSYYFFPIERPFSGVFYETAREPPGSNFLAKMNNHSYGAHLWNSMTGSQKALHSDYDQVFTVLARLHCPLTMARAAQFHAL